MNIYEQLREILDTHPSGAPESETFYKIMGILFTPEEAALAVHMSFVPKSVKDIASTAGTGVDEAEKLLESMADKTIVYCRDKGGERQYALLPTIPGLFEFPLMKGGGTPTAEKLEGLWEKYHSEGLSAANSGEPTPMARVVPVNHSLDAQDKVHPYEEVAGLIEETSYIAIAHCACRISMNKCDAPRDVCMIFGSPARFLVQRGHAREVTKTEAFEALDRAEKAGLMHISNNSADRANFICNCCPCCCTILRGRTDLNLPNAFATSAYRAVVNADECSGCGDCEERCPMKAIEIIDEIAQVNSEECIGCGLCVTGCPTEAIQLESLSEPPEISATVQEMGLKIAKEKGKLEKFLKIMQR